MKKSIVQKIFAFLVPCALAATLAPTSAFADTVTYTLMPAAYYIQDGVKQYVQPNFITSQTHGNFATSKTSASTTTTTTKSFTYESSDNGLIDPSDTFSVDADASKATEGMYAASWRILTPGGVELAASSDERAQFSFPYSWYKNKNVTTLYLELTLASRIYSVIYDANGGDWTAGQPTGGSYRYAQGAKTPSLNRVTRTGYTMSGWNTAKNGSGSITLDGATAFTGKTFGITEREEEITLYAQWDAQRYKITWNLNGGALATATNAYTYGVGLTLPLPAREGYTFDGWYEDATFAGDPVTAIGADETGDRTFHAKWTLNQYDLWLEVSTGVTAIRYQVNGQAFFNETRSNLQVKVDFGTEWSAYAEVATGCTSNSTCAASGTMGTGGARFVPEPTFKHYALQLIVSRGVSKICYKTNAAQKAWSSTTKTVAVPVAYGATWSAYAVAASGYAYSATSADLPKTGVMTEEGATFNPVSGEGGVAGNPIYVRYSDNGVYSEGTMADDTFTYGTEQCLRLNAYKATCEIHYNGNGVEMSDDTAPTAQLIFNGWSEARDGSAGLYHYADGESVLNPCGSTGNDAAHPVILYAQWTSAPVTLPAAPVRTGWELSGWYTAIDGGTRVGGAGDTYAASASITLYAHWRRAAVRLQFVNDNQVLDDYTRTVRYGETYETFGSLPVLTSNDPKYVFLGWFTAPKDSEGRQITDSSVVDLTEDTLLYARWEQNDFLITYVTNGGTINDYAKPSYSYGQTFALPTDVTRSGYTFLGWYDNATFEGTPVQRISSIDTGDKTFYAKWRSPSGATYTFKYVNVTGYTWVSNEVEYAYVAQESADKPSTLSVTHASGVSATHPEAIFFREGMTQIGWRQVGAAVMNQATRPESVWTTTYKTNATFGTVTQDLTFHAIWETNKYNIAYDGNGGLSSDGEACPIHPNVSYGEGKILASAFTHTNANDYAFVGWGLSTNGPAVFAAGETNKNLTTVPDATVTLYAQWKEKATPLTPVAPNTNLWSGVSETGATCTFKDSDETVTATLQKVVTGPGTLTFTWQALRGQGELSSATITIGNNETILIVDTSAFGDEGKTNYSFRVEDSGTTNVIWKIAGKGARMGDNNPSCTISNLSWEPDETAAPSIVFARADEPNAVDSVATNSVVLAGDVFTRAGYTIAGWLDRSGKTHAVGETVTVSELPKGTGLKAALLTAVWEPITYNIQFDRNGAKDAALANLPCVYDRTYALPTTILTRDKLTFAGWSTEPNGPVKYAAGALVRNLRDASGDITLYAAWTGSGQKFVKITGHTATQHYTGKPISVSGYDVELQSAGYYEKDFEFIGPGTTTITATDVLYDAFGNVTNYVMGLTKNSFTNISESVESTNVVFDVTDGWLRILPSVIGGEPSAPVKSSGLSCFDTDADFGTAYDAARIREAYEKAGYRVTDLSFATSEAGPWTSNFVFTVSGKSTFWYRLTAVGYETFTHEVAVNVSAANLSAAAVAVAGSPFAYTGAAITPKVTVTLGAATLAEGTDYYLTYADNIEPGTGTVTVVGRNNYTGRAAATFAIIAAESSDSGSGTGSGGDVSDVPDVPVVPDPPDGSGGESGGDSGSDPGTGGESGGGDSGTGGESGGSGSGTGTGGESGGDGSGTGTGGESGSGDGSGTGSGGDVPDVPDVPVVPESPDGTVGLYYGCTLADLAEIFDFDITGITAVKAEGLPTGLSLKKTSGSGSYWYIEGVPTVAVDPDSFQCAYLRLTRTVAKAKVETLVALPIAIAAAEVVDLPAAEKGEAYDPVNLADVWYEVAEATESATAKAWSFSGWPTGIKLATKAVSGADAYQLYGTPTKSGWFTVTATHKVTSSFTTATYREKYTARFAVEPSGDEPEATEPTYSEFDLGEAVAEEGLVSLTVGLPVEWYVWPAEESATVAVTGLPTGLKFKKTTADGETVWQIAGVPTKAGNFVATVKTTYAKVTTVQRIGFVVAALPAAMVGTYYGAAENDASGAAEAFTLTLAASGKISGSVYIKGKRVSFTAAALDDWEDLGEGDGRYRATIAYTYDKVKYMSALIFEPGAVATATDGSEVQLWQLSADPAEGDLLTAVEAQRDALKQVFGSKVVAKTTTYAVADEALADGEYLNVKVTTAGVATVSGKLWNHATKPALTAVSQSTRLAIDEDGACYCLIAIYKALSPAPIVFATRFSVAR